MCVSHFVYPFIHQWTLRLFSCLGYCEWCCRWWRCRYLFEIVISFFLDYLPRSGIAESYNSSIFNFLRTLHTGFHNGHTDLHTPKYCISLFSTALPTLFSVVFFVVSHCGFDLIFLMISAVEHLSKHWLSFVCILWKKNPAQVLCPFINVFSFAIALYEFLRFAKYIFIPWVAIFFHFADCFFCCVEVFQFDIVHLFIFAFAACVFGVYANTHYQDQCQGTFPYVFFFFPSGFTVSGVLKKCLLEHCFKKYIFYWLCY